jgi:hypothetical protein
MRGRCWVKLKMESSSNKVQTLERSVAPKVVDVVCTAFLENKYIYIYIILLLFIATLN